MIQLKELGRSQNDSRIFKRFTKVDSAFKCSSLVVKLNFSSPKHIHGMFYIPPLMRQEVGNFMLSKELQTHPYWDYVDIPTGPQVSWFSVYPQYRKKGISIEIYEGLVRYFGALYSDHSQTIGGTGIWKSLINRKNVNVYAVQWRKKDWKIVSVTKQTNSNLDEYFIESELQTILVAVPSNKEIKEFKISDVEESIEVAYRG